MLVLCSGTGRRRRLRRPRGLYCGSNKGASGGKDRERKTSEDFGCCEKYRTSSSRKAQEKTEAAEVKFKCVALKFNNNTSSSGQLIITLSQDEDTDSDFNLNTARALTAVLVHFYWYSNFSMIRHKS